MTVKRFLPEEPTHHY